MDWLATELLTGFQKLLCLGLDRTPATDLIPGTVRAWHEAITTGREWDQSRDSGRIRVAFVTLAQTRDSWPAPRHFLDALPRVEQVAIGYEVKPVTAEQAEANIARLKALLGDVAEPVPYAAPDRAGSTQDVERELRQHYDRKSQAAGEGA